MLSKKTVGHIKEINFQCRGPGKKMSINTQEAFTSTYPDCLSSLDSQFLSTRAICD